MSVWEGSGNVAALDTLRAMAKQPESLQVFFDELDTAAGADTRLDTAVASLKNAFTDVDTIQYRARHVVGAMALVLQGSLLVRHGHPAVSDAFCVGRLTGEGGSVFGILPPGIDVAPILERATVKLG